MKLTGWGRYPESNATVVSPLSREEFVHELCSARDIPTIARGLGRSYGDSSLARRVLQTSYLNHLMAFDSETGELMCAAGVSIDEILAVFVPKGWFVPVTPGTKYVTVGGAIASDVHGKNHHLHGTFCDHVSSMTIATVSSGIIECSRDNHTALFHATCGGMGLTGVVLDATFKMLPISGANVRQRTFKAHNIVEAIDLFEQHKETTYSVAWIDCLATGESLGRSLVMVGEHLDEGELTAGKPARFSVPFDMPGFLMNRFSIQLFNALYFARSGSNPQERICHYESFFYPLDRVRTWNRIYGKSGFTQYQFVLPEETGVLGMTEILEYISQSRRASFLAVLKTFGPENDNYLSFPMQGYTLALDFKIEAGLFDLLDELDDIVLKYGGRIYLTKDARMSESIFKQSYPKWQEFFRVRKETGAFGVLASLQSERLGI